MIDIETKLRNMTMPSNAIERQAECGNKINIVKHLTPTKVDVFKFPRPPNIPRVRSQSSSSNCACSSDSDTQPEERLCKTRHRMRRTCPISISRNNIRTQENLSCSPKSFSTCLPPIGVFWDIENCNVPRGCSAVTVAEVIRTSFFEGYREAEFIVVCDVTKESSKVIEELTDAQVSLVHVPSLHKNAADEKLRQAMRRFADTHGSPAAIVLITSDINFIADVCDLRHRHKIHVILLHRSETVEALLVSANEAYNIETVFESLPQRVKATFEPFQLTVSNLPPGQDGVRLRNRLRRVSDNCGGRVVHLQNTTATLMFTTRDLAQRAQKRMQGADVFGHKICVGTPIPLEKDNGKSETEDERLGSESPQVMASSDEYQNNMSRFAGAFGNAGSNLFSNGDWRLAPRADRSSAFCNVQSVSTFPSRSHCSHAPSISVTYTLPLVPASMGWVGAAMPGLWPPSSLPRDLGLFHKAIDDRTFSRCLRVAMEYSGSNSGVQVSTTTLNQLSQLPQQNGQAVVNGGGSDDRWQAGDKIKLANSRPKTPDQMRSIVKTRHDGDDLYVAPQGSVSNGGRSNNAVAKSRRRAGNGATNGATNGFGGANGRSNGSPFGSGSSEEDHEHYFQLISAGKPEPVELHVTNLDPKVPDLKAQIHRMFSEHLTVVHVAILTQSDGSMAARVKVGSTHDAQLAISQFHRRIVGRKRLLISQPGQATGNLRLVRSRLVSLLSSVPNHSLPLLTFIEVFESRFRSSVSLADIYKLKDVCAIVEDDKYVRSIQLLPGQNRVPSQAELGQCPEHYLVSTVWEADDGTFPPVHISLPTLAYCAQGLIASHNGALPLATIMRCYEASYGPLPVSENAVPLEHLLSCIAGIEIHVGVAGKMLRWAAEEKPPVSAAKGPSPRLVEQQTQLSREIVELLKKFPRCQISFGKLIPAYHHHFSRQCRVADYGYTKLADLLDSMPHVVQVMGIGERREVTLSHRAQLRRFTADVLRMLKAQASRQVTVDEFADVYKRATGREWDVYDYGVCELSDLLDSLNESAVSVTYSENSTVISIPRRTQTSAQVSNTTRFAAEVVEMLWLAPQCRIPFTKFVPAYHHYFQRQCRVADMGFNKLIELLEAIGHVAQVSEDSASGERYVSLNADLSLTALSQLVCAVLTSAPYGCLLVADIPAAFKLRYGYALCPEAHGCKSLLQLMHKLRDTVMVLDSGFGGPLAHAHDPKHLRLMALKAWRVLVEHGAALPMPAPLFLQAYWLCHREVAKLDSLATYLSTKLKVYAANGVQNICLVPTMVFAAEAYYAIIAAGGSVPWIDLERTYRSRPGAQDCADLASAVSDVIAVGMDGLATLQPELAEAGMSIAGNPEKSGAIKTTGPMGNSLLGGFPLHTAAPIKEDTSVKTVKNAESSIWDLVPDAKSKWTPIPKYLEPTKSLSGLPLPTPTFAFPADVMETLLKVDSPSEKLLPANLFESPSASKLPMPTALRSKLAATPPSDSGVNGDSGCGGELDSSAGSSGGGKHKRRLAAQFPVAVDM